MAVSRRVLSAGYALILLGCGAAHVDVRIEEDRSAQVSGHGVGLGPVYEKQRFQAGKRVTIRFATLYVDERSAIRVFGALQGNARDCAEELQARGRRPVRPPDPLTDLQVPQGEAGCGQIL